jgi:hypothetical protein
LKIQHLKLKCQNDLQQIDAIITDTTDSSEHVIESEEILIDVTDCPINASNLKSCLPEVTVTQEQKTISAGVNMLIEKMKNGQMSF